VCGDFRAGARVARSSRRDRQSQHLHEPDRADSDHEPAEIRVMLPRDRIRLVQVSPEQLARRRREVHLVASLPADAVLAMSTSIGTIASWFSGAEIVVSINARLRDIRRCPKDEDDAGRDDRGAA